MVTRRMPLIYLLHSPNLDFGAWAGLLVPCASPLINSAERRRAVTVNHVGGKSMGGSRGGAPDWRSWGGRFVVVAILLVSLLGNRDPGSPRPPYTFSQWAALSSGFPSKFESPCLRPQVTTRLRVGP